MGPPPTQGGEVVLKSTVDNSPCPRYAIMQPRLSAGDKFVINPINPNETYGLIPLEEPFTFTTKVDPTCDEETGVLRMTKRNKIIGIWHFTANGVANTSYSCFQFKRFPLPTVETPTYLLNYCPYKCNDEVKKPKCYQIGNRTSTSSGQQLGAMFLTSGGFPFEFAIKTEKLVPVVSL